MITTVGKLRIKQYLEGSAGTIADRMAFGVGSRAEALTDTDLQFEIDREDLTVVAYDYTLDHLIFKAPLPLGQCFIYEMGLFATQVANANQSRLITTFSSADEVWDAAAVFNSTNTRVGIDSLTQTAAASASATNTLSDATMDLLDLSSLDKIMFALFASANVANVKFQFQTDAANYFTFTTSPSAGYNVIEVLKSAAVVTGAPDWANITALVVTTTATSGGTATVNFDGIRVKDTDSDTNQVLVARQVLSVSPYQKIDGRVEDAEIYIPFSI